MHTRSITIQPLKKRCMPADCYTRVLLLWLCKREKPHDLVDLANLCFPTSQETDSWLLRSKKKSGGHRRAQNFWTLTYQLEKKHTDMFVGTFWVV